MNSSVTQPVRMRPPSPGGREGDGRKGEGMRLPSIPYLRLRFTLRALAPAHLPAYKGSLLRGAFGHALRRAVCAMGRGHECSSCPLRRVCLYTKLFEAFIEGEPPPMLRGIRTSPRPYVFEPITTERDFDAGDPLRFDLVLFGQAIELQALALLAVERMARSGLGRDRHLFALDRVEALAPGGSWTTVAAHGKSLSCGALPASPELAESAAPHRVTLRFLTPTQLPHKGRLVTPTSFRSLAFLMLRRVLEMAHFHVPGADVDWTFRPLLQQADAVRIIHSDLHWQALGRWSNRQQQRVAQDGFVGELSLEGELAPFVPLLRRVEILHVGKGATFGLGHVVAIFDN